MATSAALRQTARSRSMARSVGTKGGGEAEAGRVSAQRRTLAPNKPMASRTKAAKMPLAPPSAAISCPAYMPTAGLTANAIPSNEKTRARSRPR